jgi:hypothetical protein
MTILNVVLWIAQGLLAVVFLISGLARVFGSKTWLLQRGQTDVLRYESPMIHLIGALELLSAVALVLPWLTGFAAFLTPLAAAGIGALMLAAASAHARLARENRGDLLRRYAEMRDMGTNMLVLLVCAVIFVGRGLMHIG